MLFANSTVFSFDPLSLKHSAIVQHDFTVQSIELTYDKISPANMGKINIEFYSLVRQ